MSAPEGDSLQHAADSLRLTIGRIEAALAAEDDREDVREMLRRLERLVTAQGEDLRALAVRLDHLSAR